VTPAGEASRGVAMRECRNCGHVVFPPRALCPGCGAWDWKPRRVECGVVEAVTRAGGNELASVRTDAGPVVTALVIGQGVESQARVRLESRVAAGRGGPGVQVCALLDT